MLFNSGDKQAVVRYKGQLSIDDSIINLKKKEALDTSSFFMRINSDSFLSNFVVIESKSFNGMTLVVDFYNNRKYDIEYSQREYNSGQKMAILSIYDIKDSAFRNEAFFFRNALVEEEKESLKVFLVKEFKKYLAPSIN